MKLPLDVKTILRKLNDNKFESYVVGGCVRDTLLGKTPKDWDICTNAKPEEVMKVFKGFNIIPTGLQHGTITVMVNKEGYEITTYRVDGDYSDGRHPDNVSFTFNLADDLARRDFTINAMAYSELEGLVDLYGGVTDLKNGIIRCVGKPLDRFNEDALRIMRAMRFASVLNFKIDTETKTAMVEIYKNLNLIAKERINVEFSKLLMGTGNAKILDEYSDIIGFIIPEVKPMFGFNQNNSYHYLDVWEHTLKVVENVNRTDLSLVLSAFFHDIGKPNTYTEADGVGHFYKHPLVSMNMTEGILRRLKFSNDIIEEVLTLVKYHDVEFVNSNKFIRRMLNKMSKETFEKLIELKKADILGQSKKYEEKRIKHMSEIMQTLQDFDFQNECFSLKQVKLNGNDLMSMGFKPEKLMGVILNDLLDKIVEEKLENEPNILKKYVIKNYSS